MPKNLICFALILLIVISCKSPQASLSSFVQYGKWIDLTYTFSDSTIFWPNNLSGFKLESQFRGFTTRGFFYSSNQMSTPEHGGTHIDAPIHFSQNKKGVDQIPVEQLVGSAVIIDVTDHVKDNADYLVQIPEIESWEKSHGKIPNESMVFIRTGWGKYYPDKEKYLGTNEKGDTAVRKLHFPSIHPDLAEWLVTKRKIKALGVDVASTDYGQSLDFKTHQILGANNIVGFENVANLELVPPTGSYVIALPMKIKNGTGAALRIIAWVPLKKK